MRKNGNSNGAGQPAVLTSLCIPGVDWDEKSYATLQMQLNLYTDFVTGCKFDKTGEPGPLFMVDPLALAGALAQLPSSTGLLPHDCLFWSRVDGDERIGVYIAPQVWPVSVSGESETWRVPLPGLVFVGQAMKYRLFAAKERPARAMQLLYVAPVPNMSTNICRGNAPFPPASAGTIWQAVAAFFESEFNGHLSNGKSKAHPGSILEHWRALHEAGAVDYPLDDLIPTDIRLDKLME